MSIAFAIALAIIVTWDVLSALRLLVAILASLSTSATTAALIAAYRLSMGWVSGGYHAVIRGLASITRTYETYQVTEGVPAVTLLGNRILSEVKTISQHDDMLSVDSYARTQGYV